MKKFSIPLQTEVFQYMKEKKGWPDQFCEHYAEKFWNHYAASGWKLSSGNQIKDWKACFNAQWQTLKFKEDIELFIKLSGKLKPGSFHVSVLDKEAKRATKEEMLDAFIDELRRPGIGVNIPFEHFGDWYEYMKEQRLLKPFTKNEVEELKTIYKNDNQLCRCAVVQKTLMGYINNGLRVSDLLKMRAAL